MKIQPIIKGRFLVFITALIAITIFLQGFVNFVAIKKPKLETLKFANISVGNTMLTVELAKTSEEFTRGLSGRKEIGSGGMLFILPERTTPTFWMKDMLFPLDFVWIDGDVIVDLTANVPPPAPNTPEKSLPVYRPRTAVTHVLELPAGSIEKYGLQVGQKMTFLTKSTSESK